MDSLTLVELASKVKSCLNQLSTLEKEVLQSGYEEKILVGELLENGEYISTGLALTNYNIPDCENFRKNVLIELRKYLEDYFVNELELGDILKEYIRFNLTCDTKRVHKLFAKDLNLLQLNVEFFEISHDTNLIIELEKAANLSEKIKCLLYQNYPITVTILSRILAIKPSSADVERLISLNNTFKTSLRSSFEIMKENEIMYININMPVLERFNPRIATELFFKEKPRRYKASATIKSQACFKGIFMDAK